jgi:hypothetical protein
LDQAAKKAGYGLTVTSVRYSYAQLVALYDQLAGSNLPGDACISYGVDAEANALRFTLTRLDMEIVAYILERVPAEAVRVTVEPRAQVAPSLSRWQRLVPLACPSVPFPDPLVYA